MRIDGQVAVITGAAGGIGRALSEDLIQRGIKGLGMVDASPKIDAVVDKLNADASRNVATAFVGDTTDENFRKAVFAELKQTYGTPCICVPAAAITRDELAVRIHKETGKAAIYPVETFRKVMEVNFVAPIYWALETVASVAEDRAARGLKRWTSDEEMQGTIIFIGSIASVGNKGQISYSSAKAGLEGAAATLTMEAIYHGVRCGVIHPGFTDTPMVRALGEEFIKTHVLPQTQLGRLIQPAEIAEAICFMIGNSAVSGQLWADAGWRPAV
ncbi:MAG TPA: SDR family NAD(P)-dependent oxidoreductase [Opitutaceae bacterium]